MTQRLFRTFPNFKVASMASTRRHATAAPSPRPHESPRVSRESHGRVATVSVPHRSRLEDARLHITSKRERLAHGRRVLAEAVAQVRLREGC